MIIFFQHTVCYRVNTGLPNFFPYIIEIALFSLVANPFSPPPLSGPATKKKKFCGFPNGTMNIFDFHILDLN